MLNNFITNKIFILFLIFFLAAGCSETSKETNTSVVGIADMSPGAAINSRIEIAEGHAGSFIAVVGFTAITDGTVKYSTYDIDAVAKSDYAPLSGEYEMAAGQSYEVGIEIYSDTRVEDNERIGVLITDTSDNELGRLIITLINDDYPGYQLTRSDVTEGHVGTQYLEYTITLNESTVAPYQLSISTDDRTDLGYALAGVDYKSINTQVTFNAGEMSKSIAVEVNGDRDIENDEIIKLDVQHLDFDPISIQGYIRSDDTPGNGAPTFELNAGRSLLVAENTSGDVFQMPFSIDESSGFTEDFTLNYKLANLASELVITGAEKAERGLDFDENLGQIVILAGEENLSNEYIAEFTITDDNLLENNEVLQMVLYNDAGVVFGSGRIYISDNESPEFVIYRKFSDNDLKSTDLSFLEDEDAEELRKIYVELAGPVGYEYQFEYTLRYATAGEVVTPNQSAVNAEDVSSSANSEGKLDSRIITIAKGSSIPSKTTNIGIPFIIRPDTQVETTDVMFVELRNLNGNSLGEPVEVKIINDDLPSIRWANKELIAPATVDSQFISYEENNLNLVLQIDNEDTDQTAINYNDLALEDYNILIERIVTTGSTTSGCESLNQKDISLDELNIPREGSNIFSASTTELPVTLSFVDDEDVECDEVVDLKVSLSSQHEWVEHVSSDQIEITSQNTDKAALSVYGFSVEENIDGLQAKFQISLNSNISLAANFVITSAGIEAEDGSITFNDEAVALGQSTAINFDASAENRTQEIVVNLVDDNIVELDESYQLTVTLDDQSPVLLKNCGYNGECLSLNDLTKSTSVVGLVSSEDKTQIVISERNGGSLIESDFINPNNAYPYEVTLTKVVAADVPNIVLGISDDCLLLDDDSCAHGDDFNLATTYIHTQGSQTDTSSKLLNASFSNDDVVEPTEIANLNVFLNNNSNLSDYIDSWSNVSLALTITNDDKIKPYFVGTLNGDNKLVASANEGDDVSSTANVAITWAEQIAANVPANLALELSTSCASDGCSADDYSLAAKAVYAEARAGNKASPGSSGESLGLLITGDTTVEPSETITLGFAASNSDYFDITYFDDVDKTVLEYTIANDDRVKPYFVGTPNDVSGFIESSQDEGNSENNVDRGINIAWDENIAANVKTQLSINLNAACTECTFKADNAVNPDISYGEGNNAVEIHAGTGSATNANTGLSIGLKVNQDKRVEPDEIVVLTMSGGTANFVENGKNTERKHTIKNDDYIKPRFTAASANHTEKASVDGSASADIQISWLEDVASNVGELTLSLTASCGADECTLADGSDPDVNYTGSKDVTLTTAELASKTKTLDLTVKGDDLVEPDETLVLTLNSNSGYFKSSESAQQTFELTIKNDDSVKPYFVGTPAASGFIETEVVEGNSESNVDGGINIAWKENIAANVKTKLSINLTTVCTECTLAADSAVNPDVSYGAGDNAVEIHAGTGSATNANTGLSIGLTVNQDTRVEPDEIVVLTMNGGTANFVENGKNTKRKHTIKNDDYVDVTVTSPNKKEGTVSGNAAYSNADITLSWDQVIDSNVPALNVTVSTVCDASVLNSNCTLTGTYADIGSVSTSITIPINASSKVISIPVKQDDFIEVDEVINVSFTPAESTKVFFKNNTIPISSLTIQDLGDTNGGDSIAVTLTGSATVLESVGRVAWVSWAAQRIESHTEFKFSTTLSGNQYVTAGDVSFETAGCAKTGSVLTCTLSLGENQILAEQSNKLLMSVVDDNMVELEESMILTPAGVSGGVPVTGSAATYRVQNNDFVTVSLDHADKAYNESENIGLKIKLCADCTISDEAKSASFSIENSLVKVESDFEPMPSVDINSDLKNLITSAQLANFTAAEVSTEERSAVIATVVQDAVKEDNEWLNFYVSQSSLCPDAGCLGEDMSAGLTNTYYDSSLNEGGLVVILNDDYIASSDTNVSQCLDISGSPGSYVSSLTSPSAEGCSSASLQDVELEFKNNAYSFVSSAGLAVKNKVNGAIPDATDYNCVQDNNKGVLWNVNHKITQITFAEASLASTYCGKANTGSADLNWQLPTVSDLIGILDFNDLTVGETTRFKNLGSYWTRNSCDANLTSYWVVDMATGLTTCAEQSANHYSHAVYY